MKVVEAFVQHPVHKIGQGGSAPYNPDMHPNAGVAAHAIVIRRVCIQIVRHELQAMQHAIFLEIVPSLIPESIAEVGTVSDKSVDFQPKFHAEVSGCKVEVSAACAEYV